jgi:hypothetical protein
MQPPWVASAGGSTAFHYRSNLPQRASIFSMFIP